MDEEARRHARLLQGPGEVARLLRHPGGGRLGGAARQVDSPRAYLAEDQPRPGLKAARLHRAAVPGQQLVGLALAEGAPGRGADRVAALAPAWVLPRQPEDGGRDRGRDGGPLISAGAPGRAGALALAPAHLLPQHEDRAGLGAGAASRAEDQVDEDREELRAHAPDHSPLP